MFLTDASSVVKLAKGFRTAILAFFEATGPSIIHSNLDRIKDNFEVLYVKRMYIPKPPTPRTTAGQPQRGYRSCHRRHDLGHG